MLTMALTLVCKAEQADTLVIDGNEIREQIFPVSPFPEGYQLNFTYPFEEVYLSTEDQVKLHALLFLSSNSKGVILYLHGSNGASDVWGEIAPIYTKLGYDFFLLDYRGYGKSKGTVVDEQQICNDVRLAYDFLAARYTEQKIIVIGQSIGSGSAAYLAANNRPRKLILQAPYYSIEDWIHQLVPSLQIVDNLFKFETSKRLAETTCPIVLIHGDADDAVYYGSSEKLSKFLKPKDRFITLKGEKHNDFTKNQEYLKVLRELLE